MSAFVVAGGRGRTGKSVLLRWAVQRALDAGHDVVIADGDRTNASLVARFGDLATQPPSPAPGDMFAWVCGLVDQQIEDRRTVYLDLGGGDQTLATWAREMDPVPMLIEHGIDPVMLYCLSSDLDDLQYVHGMERLFPAPHTALVFNEGVTPPDCAPHSVFQETRTLLGSTAFADLTKRAVMVRLPRLRNMQAVERKEELLATGAAQVRIWERKVQTEMADIAGWLV